MLTEEQEKWIDHLSDEKIKIIPYNPKTAVVFDKIKKEIQKVLGNVKVFHRGSTSLKISGQKEIDVYLPVNSKDFNGYLEKLTTGCFGRAGTVYPLSRARFVKYIDEIKIEIFLINEKSVDWKNGLKFEGYLKKHPDILNEYENLKKSCNGFSCREYYRKKLNFIDEILEK